ncbi:ROK family transcriptional regulator [Cellulomonas sp. RIT-PI-Y]|uniref:ROK family transcriptional regulator n=1 Tax=Cellulomonas sp. RIT-PI-Y TaxID=3035297 RepID=UPI0021D86C72|nr:ROK family transcriptional regulator [Cellulomonas sp. RIT-PI-Y]
MSPSTRVRVLDLLRTAGTLSRVELADRTGLTPATITHAVRDLIGDGLVHEVGRARSNGGSPRRLLELVADARYAVGIQLDRCRTTVVVTNFFGRRLAGTVLPGVGHGEPADTLAALAAEVERVLAEAAVPRGLVLGAGLVTHGPQDRARGVIRTAQPTPAWQDFPLTATLSALLDLPVLLENDATAAAVGEQWAGDAGTDTFGVLYLASGIGGGVILGGDVYGDDAANVVEVGHIPLDPTRSGVCGCGNVGCTEQVAGPFAVVREAALLPGVAGRLGLTGDPDRLLDDFDALARAALDGDTAVRRVLDRAAAHLGAAAVTLMNLFDLDTVVLAGPGFAVAGPLVLAAARPVVERGALARLLRPVQLRMSADPEAVAAVGGALVVLRGSRGTDLSTGPVGRVSSPGATLGEVWGAGVVPA